MKLPKIAWVSLALLVLILPGCSTPAPDEPESSSDSTSEPELGSVDLRLTFPDGVVLESLTYVITEWLSTVEVVAGEIPIGDEPLVSFQIGGLPVSPSETFPGLPAYDLQLSAVLSGGEVCSLAVPEWFSVNPGQTTVIQTFLYCGGEFEPVTGDARVEVTLQYEQCAHVVGITALPLRVPVGEAISLQATASTPNGFFYWNVSPPSGGTFLESFSAVTSFVCAEAGTHQLLLSVETPGTPCPWDMRSLSVTCLPSSTTPPP